MSYLLLPIALTVAFVLYILYLVFYRKNKARLKAVLPIGALFLAIWALGYYFFLK